MGRGFVACLCVGGRGKINRVHEASVFAELGGATACVVVVVAFPRHRDPAWEEDGAADLESSVLRLPGNPELGRVSSECELCPKTASRDQQCWQGGKGCTCLLFVDEDL